MGLSYKNMTILVGCGAAGAVAGIFKAPMAGVLFTLEILLFNISMSSILPLLLSTVSATVVSYLLLGPTVPFESALAPFEMRNIPFYIVLAVFCALGSLYFTRTTLWLEDRIRNIGSIYLRWFLSALSLGLLIFLFPPLYGEGYGVLSTLLNGQQPSYEGVSVLSGMLDRSWSVPVFFLLVMLLKVFSMSFTNAGGGVGGTFGPTLFVGGIAGFVVARTLNLVLGAGAVHPVPEQNFVLVGMAGMMAGVMQAPMTAIFLIAEISGGYGLLIPLILTSTVSYGLTRMFEKYSIYTKRIANRGELLTHDSDQAVLVLLDTPSHESGIYISGGVMAAPTVGAVMADILPYLGVEKFSYDGIEALLANSYGAAALLMVFIMLPGFLLAMYERHGQPLEVVVMQMIQCCFLRPKERPYQTNNAYAALMRQHQMEQSQDYPN